jgi:hypothetical protein
MTLLFSVSFYLQLIMATFSFSLISNLFTMAWRKKSDAKIDKKSDAKIDKKSNIEIDGLLDEVEKKNSFEKLKEFKVIDDVVTLLSFLMAYAKYAKYSKDEELKESHKNACTTIRRMMKQHSKYLEMYENKIFELDRKYGHTKMYDWDEMFERIDYGHMLLSILNEYLECIKGKKLNKLHKDVCIAIEQNVKQCLEHTKIKEIESMAYWRYIPELLPLLIDYADYAKAEKMQDLQKIVCRIIELKICQYLEHSKIEDICKESLYTILVSALNLTDNLIEIQKRCARKIPMCQMKRNLIKNGYLKQILKEKKNNYQKECTVVKIIPYGTGKTYSEGIVSLHKSMKIAREKHENKECECFCSCKNCWHTICYTYCYDM